MKFLQGRFIKIIYSKQKVFIQGLGGVTGCNIYTKIKNDE
jgi:hypothetical protein